MSYRSELEARLAKKTTKAIVDYQMLEDGDRIMVGLSGGKDSWALIQILDVLRRRAPVTFSLVAVNVDSGYKEYKHDVIAKTCEARGWEYRIEHTGIGEAIEDILDVNQTPCSLCARLRRGVLYRVAAEVGATKIALGHHADDFIETLLLNVFFAGALKATPATLASVAVVDAAGEREIGRIPRGVMVLLGVEREDGPADVQYIAGKIRDLRLFEDPGDPARRFERSVTEVNGAVLVVSQFTLAADCR